jgi:hypothetical protein
LPSAGAGHVECEKGGLEQRLDFVIEILPGGAIFASNRSFPPGQRP